MDQYQNQVIVQIVLIIKHELYRHRRQIKREAIVEEISNPMMHNGMMNGNGNRRNDQYNRTQSSYFDDPPTIEIKIKGSNFETLLKKLVKYGDETHSCIECKRSFFQKCHLLRHIREKHLVKSPVHECPFCLKTFHQNQI